VEDNPYVIEPLAPDEFDDLLGVYENYVEWCEKSMTDKQRELSSRVLERLRQADATHVCVDEQGVKRRAVKNPCGKTVTPDTAYEVWRVENHPQYGGQWTWYVLKKYQTLEKEAANPHARWLCFVTSPYVPSGECGDTYVSSIRDTGAVKLDFNPLVQAKGKEQPDETLDRGA
jgi:hypothetical protein